MGQAFSKFVNYIFDKFNGLQQGDEKEREEAWREIEAYVEQLTKTAEGDLPAAERSGLAAHAKDPPGDSGMGVEEIETRKALDAWWMELINEEVAANGVGVPALERRGLAEKIPPGEAAATIPSHRNHHTITPRGVGEVPVQSSVNFLYVIVPLLFVLGIIARMSFKRSQTKKKVRRAPAWLADAAPKKEFLRVVVPEPAFCDKV